MQRVWVVGNAGSGKTTAARTLAARLDVPHVELDAIYHQAGWQPLPVEDFRRLVTERLSAPAWTVDGNYSAVADLVLARADTVVWLDLPRPAVMRQLAARTFRRTVLRTELWNGNREPLTGWLSRDPEKSIMLWAWRNHRTYADRYAPLASRRGESDQVVVRLRSRREVDAFLGRISPVAPS